MTKTDVPKPIDIHPQLLPVIIQAMEKSKSVYLFPNENGQPLHKNAMRTKMMQICKKAGIPKATTHDLRHTWNTVSKMKGLSEDARQKIGGWSSKKIMDDTYTHVPDAHIRAEYFALDYMPKAPAEELKAP